MYLFIFEDGGLITRHNLDISDFESADDGILDLVRHTEQGFEQFYNGEWNLVNHSSGQVEPTA